MRRMPRLCHARARVRARLFTYASPAQYRAYFKEVAHFFADILLLPSAAFSSLLHDYALFRYAPLLLFMRHMRLRKMPILLLFRFSSFDDAPRHAPRVPHVAAQFDSAAADATRCEMRAQIRRAHPIPCRPFCLRALPRVMCRRAFMCALHVRDVKMIAMRDLLPITQR